MLKVDVIIISFEVVYAKKTKGGGAEIMRRAEMLIENGFNVKILSFGKPSEQTTRPDIETVIRREISLLDVLRLRPIPIASRPFEAIKKYVKNDTGAIFLIEGFQSSSILVDSDLLENSQVFLRVHNWESKYHLQMSLGARGIRKLYHYLTYLQYTKYENILINSVKSLYHISSLEQNLMRLEYPSAKHELFSPISKPIPCTNKKGKFQRIIIFGDMTVPGNSAGLQWFIDNVWEKIHHQFDHLTLDIYGIGSERFAGFGINGYGYVNDISEKLSEKSSLLIMPVMYGGGVKIKAIDVISSGIPCIYSKKALEGIDERICSELPKFSTDNPVECVREVRKAIEFTDEMYRIAEKSSIVSEKYHSGAEFLNAMIRAGDKSNDSNINSGI
jgi:Glycosyl transferases group 1